MPNVDRGLEGGFDVSRARAWLRWCALGLVISGGGIALGYAVVGHTLIDSLYEGPTGMFRDGIIQGQHLHPVEYYYALADRRVLQLIVQLCLFAWGLLCFSSPSPTRLLVLLLATDLVLIILDLRYGAAAGFYQSFFAITRDGGYGETFQYAKEFGILLFFFLFFLQYRHLMFLGWQVFFFYVLLDDSLQLHENLGAAIAQSLPISEIAGLRAKDFGELAISGLFGVGILSLLGACYYYATHTLRKIFWTLLGWVMILALCGVVFDMIQVMITPSRERMYAIFGIADDGGEMLTISAIAWYVSRLATNWPRLFGANLPATEEGDDAFMEEVSVDAGHP